jgi:hypothetical protein
MNSGLSLNIDSPERGPLPADTSDHIRCLRVEVSASGIREWRNNKISRIIPRDQIRQITLCSGTDVKYPFCRFGVGLALFSLGLIIAAASFLALIGRGFPSEPGIFMLPLTPLALLVIAAIGLWTLAGVFRVGHFFLIETEKGVRRISFGNTADIGEIRRFIWKVKMRFGYVIGVSALHAETQLE